MPPRKIPDVWHNDLVTVTDPESNIAKIMPMTGSGTTLEPREPTPAPIPTPAPPTLTPPTLTPPGPIQLELRIDGRIHFLQRVYAYTIDQQTDQAIITAHLTPAADA